MDTVCLIFQVVRWEVPRLAERTFLYWVQAICGDQGRRMLDAL